MALALVVFGILLISTGFQNKTREFFSQLKEDGAAFISWLFVLVAVLVVREFQTTKPIANVFLMLIVIAFILGNGKSIAENFSKTLNQTGG